MSTVKPFSPDQALANKANVIHPKMIEVVNNLLSKHYNGSSCRIYQNEVMDAFLTATNHEYTREEVYNNKWLDFESVYRENGWKVSYDKPAYCETYEAAYVFNRA